MISYILFLHIRILNEFLVHRGNVLNQMMMINEMMTGGDLLLGHSVHSAIKLAKCVFRVFA